MPANFPTKTASRVIGIDPGLQHCGWGIVEISGNQLSAIASGTISPKAKAGTAHRLQVIFAELCRAIETHMPDCAAVEESFMHNNAASAIKLGMARGMALLAPAHMGLEVSEYSARSVKKSIVGNGAADKNQIGFMVRRLLPQCEIADEHAADALAIAICHAHTANAEKQWRKVKK